METRALSSRAVAVSALVVFGALGPLGCSKAPRVEERPFVVHAPLACPIDASVAYSVVYGGGDFEPDDTAPPIASFFLAQVGLTMDGLPEATRAVVADISQTGRDLDWRGIAEVPKTGPIDVLVWPGGETCRLSRNVERRVDATLGVFGHQLLVGGGKLLEGSQVPRTFVGDLSTGALDVLELGLRSRRARPTITAFTAVANDPFPAALVAGGADPESGTSLDTAEIYVPKAGGAGDFDRTRVELSEARSRHGAAVLADGSTVLVGGIGRGGTPLRSMEIVDPRTKQSRSDGLALLAVARSNPTVLRLASGEILVAGGLDARGNPVATLEWFAPDASRPSKRPVDLVTGRARGFVPLEAGGALAVIAPETGASDFKTVWIISSEGSLEPGVSIDPKQLDQVRLFAGAEGAPALWTGTRWLRWQPWFGAFSPIPDAPKVGPTTDAIANGDSGLALWLEDQGAAGMYLVGFRFAARTRFAAVPKPLLTDSAAGLAPDRLPGVPGSSIRFEPGRGIVLGPGASAFLTDVTFADFEASVDVVDAVPVLVVRQENGREVEVGGGTCAFAQAARKSIAVVRKGTRVTVTIDGAVTRDCPTELDEGARVGLGVRGGAASGGNSGARNLRVVRR